MFEEDKLIEEGQAILKKIEDSLRQLKADYQNALNDYDQLKSGDAGIFESLEAKYLTLLSKLQKSVVDTTDLWDRAIASVERMKAKKKIKAEYFLTGVTWSLDEAGLDEEKKKAILEIATALIFRVF